MPIFYEDLKDVVYPLISIDEFEPKSGDSKEVIVVAFYCMDRPPAADLNTFIQRGAFDILDSDVSTNVDEEGRYLVFVEFERNHDFPVKFMEFVKDIENTTGPQHWMVKPYLADVPMEITSNKLFKFVITEPDDYSEKDDLVDVMSESAIQSFLKNSYLSEIHLTSDKRHVIFNNKVAAEIVGFGNTQQVLQNCNLTEGALELFNVPDEVLTLRNMLGESWEVEKINNMVVLNTDSDTILVIKYPEIIY